MIEDVDSHHMKLVCEMARKYSREPVKVCALIVIHTPNKEPLLCYGINKKDHDGTIIHAEQYCIEIMMNGVPPHFAREFSDTVEASIIITKAPCLECAKLITKANIKRVVCPEPYLINPNTGKPSKWYSTQLDALTHFSENGVLADFLPITMINGEPHLTEENKDDR